MTKDELHDEADRLGKMMLNDFNDRLQGLLLLYTTTLPDGEEIATAVAEVITVSSGAYTYFGTEMVGRGLAVLSQRLREDMIPDIVRRMREYAKDAGGSLGRGEVGIELFARKLEEVLK